MTLFQRKRPEDCNAPETPDDPVGGWRNMAACCFGVGVSPSRLVLPTDQLKWARSPEADDSRLRE